MTIVLKEVRKAADVGYQVAPPHDNTAPAWNIRGTHVTVEGEEPFDSGNFEEKLNVPNDGEFVVHYGADFSGPSRLRLRGSSGGEEVGVIHIP